MALATIAILVGLRPESQWPPRFNALLTIWRAAFLRRIRETVMSQLTFACPTTGRPIASGIEIERDTFHQLRLRPTRVNCPCCGMMHQAQVQDGWLDDVRSRRGWPNFKRSSWDFREVIGTTKSMRSPRH